VTEFLADTRAIAGRHLRHLLRVPEKLIGFTVMPALMVIGLGILFGGGIQLPGGQHYGSYVAAGVVTAMAISMTALSALGVVEDLRGGVFDRLRSLPIRRASILFGRITADLLLVLVAMAGVIAAARVLGWPLGAAPLRALAASGLELLLGTGCACAGIFLGLTVRNTESTASVVPALLFPVTFLSNAFVPAGGLPGWLRWLVDRNPVSTVTGAVRELLGVAGATGSSLGLAAGFCLLLIAVAGPAAVHACRGTLLPR